jgi:hypothetical protein
MQTASEMDKLIFQDENDELIAACAGMMTTLLGDDGGVKSAASEVFSRTKLAEFRPPPGKFMVHAVAMGAEEIYGPNKNGDAFSKRALEENYNTFVTNGHMFREHRNRDPKLRIGDIKAAAYHPNLHRIEIVMWGDMEKAAKEYAILKAGKQLDFSMSCKVPHDVCSCCEKRAKSTANYCDHLSNHMLQFLGEFQKYAYAQNPDPNFFDMSAVGNRADRIARYLQADLGMQKAASAGHIITSEEWAKLAGVSLPERPLAAKPMTPARQALLEKLAKAEAEFEQLLRSGEDPKDWFSQFRLKVACRAFGADHSITKSDLTPARDLRPGTFFRELAKRAALLTPDVLWAYLDDSEPEQLEKAARQSYTHLFRDLHAEVIKSGGCANLTDLCDPGSQVSADTDPEYSDGVDTLMAKADEQFGVKAEPVEARTMQAELRGVKAAAALPVDRFSELNAEQHMLRSLYGCYKAAAVETIQQLHPELDESSLFALAIGQNFQFAMS